MAGLSPTQRTLRALRQDGRIAEVVEKWIATPYRKGVPGFRKDLFGFIDIIALCPEKGILAVQSFGSAWSQHVEKIINSEVTENVIEWINCDGFIELWGWRKVVLKRGGKAKRWKPRIGTVTIESGNLKITELKEV